MLKMLLKASLKFVVNPSKKRSVSARLDRKKRKEKIDQETIYRNIESIIIKIMELLFQPKRDLNIEEAKR